jgi:uncharacterized membrane protein YgdD (TMEM256/DUF423 family)
MSKLFIAFGAFVGFVAVMLGAFGAHGLKGRVAESLVTAFNTGAQYQMYHALALLAVGILLRLFPGKRLLKWSGGFFIAGIFLFCGSLYLLTFIRQPWLGPITPVGGLSFMVGWLLLAVAMMRKDKNA